MKKINVNTVNKVKYENLERIGDSIFEEVYRRADRLLASMILESRKALDSATEAEPVSNVISFLGERGRGKTSAMLSFLSSLNQLKQQDEKSGWSRLRLKEYSNVKFFRLPCIDAAALAEREFVLDVVLAKMWDTFAEYIKKEQGGSQNEDFLYLEKKVRDGFVKVRKAYLILKAKENKEGDLAEADEPVASALHELSASMNLRQEFQTLVKNYIQFLSYHASGRSSEKPEGYLILAIDDIDMSARMAQRILEQIRRFLSVPGILIFMTADINRLKKMCESYYSEIYKEDRITLHRFINDYLEKVLPYYMRIYMPELNENHDGFQIEKNALSNSELNLGNLNEKEVILKMIASRCQIYFDGERKKRHFLQNDSLRGLVNYFERFLQIEKEGYYAWLKIDLKERLIERIANEAHRGFMDSLLSKDYEDMNNLVIHYIAKYLGMENGFASSKRNIGQVLYACGKMEEKDAENAGFVNSILTLYSIMIAQTNGELREKIVGDSLFGEWEYAAFLSSSREAAILGFEGRSKLEYHVTNEAKAFIESGEMEQAISALVTDNHDKLLGWLYAMLFVNINKLEENAYRYTVQKYSINTIPEDDEEEGTQPVVMMGIDVQMSENADKGCFRFLHREPAKDMEKLEQLLKDQFLALGNGLFPKVDKEKLEGLAKSLCDPLVEGIKKEMKIEEDMGSVFPVQNVEILYSIGKSLQKEMISDDAGNDEGEIYLQKAERYFKIILSELEKRDRYYKEQIGMETNFAKGFQNRLQSRIFLHLNQMDLQVRRYFGDFFKEVFRGQKTRLFNPFNIV